MKIAFKFQIFILVIFSFLFSNIEIPGSDSEGWNVLHKDNQNWVGNNQNTKFPWCRAITILPYHYTDVIPIVSNFDNYSNIFERINTSKKIDTNIVYLRISMPLFFADRDYIVKYHSFKDGPDIIYQWQAITHSNVPKYDDTIRLINAAGEWRVTPLSDNQTQVSYTWNGELLGDFPSFYLKEAWETQGIEIINWLREALEAIK